MAGFFEGGGRDEVQLPGQAVVADDGTRTQQQQQPGAQQPGSSSRSSHSSSSADQLQEIEATEEQKRRLRGENGGGDDAASVSTSGKHDENTSAYDLRNRSDSCALEVVVQDGRHVDPGRLSPTMEYVSALAHLATFGILGVCIRYGLRILFFNVANITAEDSSLVVELPANMVGCFFMGWVGVVLKKDISAFSELLVVGLSTGLMGSITTYSSWNQALIFLITKGLWVRSIVGLIIGMELAQMSLLVGMDCAKAVRSLIMLHLRQKKKWEGFSPDNLRRREISLLVFLATSIFLWVGALVLTVMDVNSAVRRRLWLACVVGPPGVWARWLLARLNGQGIGRSQLLKWLPVGTLLTNVVPSTLQAMLSTVLLASPEDASLLCRGLQIGLLGCMSTVSTFVTEIHSLHQGPKRWRAYAYLCIMFFCSYSMGLLVYTLPVLTDHLPL